LQVINDRQQRNLARRLAEQRERGLEHDEPVRRLTGVAGDGSQRLTVQRAQQHQVGPQWPQELGQPGETHPGPEFAARRAQHLQARGQRGFFGRVQQRRLAHAGLAGEQERPAMGGGPLQERRGQPQFLVSSDECHRGSPPRCRRPRQVRMASAGEKGATR